MGRLHDTIRQEIDDVFTAFDNLLKKLANEQKDNWQASLAYEAVENILYDSVSGQLFGLCGIECRHTKPANFKHWRDKRNELGIMF